MFYQKSSREKKETNVFVTKRISGSKSGYSNSEVYLHNFFWEINKKSLEDVAYVRHTEQKLLYFARIAQKRIKK